MITPFDDNYYMRKALDEAKRAYELDEVPVGAVIVVDDKIIAKGHNLTERLNDVTAHAEMQSITSAAEYLGGKYLKKCTLYVTLEPCVMCAGALNWSQISKIVYGAKDERRGAFRYDNILHPSTEVVGEVLADECSELMKSFFKNKR